MYMIPWDDVIAFSRLTLCNPFLPERIEYERQVLGQAFVKAEAVWSVTAMRRGSRPNISKLHHRAEQLAAQVRPALLERRGDISPAHLAAYEDLCCYLLYYRHHEAMEALLRDGSSRARPAAFHRAFLADAGHFFQLDGVKLPTPFDPPHLLAILFQIRRAFFHVFNHVVGASLAAAKLRAGIWQSVFTHDMRRYRRSLYNRMGDFTTLITGPSGTGKEIVARAIALSRYIPFDAKTKGFREDFSTLFHPLNLSALSPTLIESELFGHRRGAFTGALEDRRGWLENCSPLGTVFLDEIGDLDPLIQVKLLRLLQSRTFQRLGEVQDRTFSGKIIAATNRDLSAALQRGAFRSDFYYRLCSDIIVTPTLREQIAESSGEMHHLILFIAQRLVGDEAESVAGEVEAWIAKNLGRDYAWPGNFRELEQCVRNVLIRREYLPPKPSAENADAELANAVQSGRLTADELLRRYCRIVYNQCHSYQETARRLGLDRRTVKSKLTE